MVVTLKMQSSALVVGPCIWQIQLKKQSNAIRPYYDAFNHTDAAKHNQSPFKHLEDNVKNGPALVGSADQVIEKILNYYEAYGHQVQSISVEGLGEAEQREQMERFATEV